MQCFNIFISGLLIVSSSLVGSGQPYQQLQQTEMTAQSTPSTGGTISSAQLASAPANAIQGARTLPRTNICVPYLGILAVCGVFVGAAYGIQSNINSSYDPRSELPAYGYTMPPLPAPAGTSNYCFGIHLRRYVQQGAEDIALFPACNQFNITTLARSSCNTPANGPYPLMFRDDTGVCDYRQKSPPYTCYTDEQITDIFPRVCKDFYGQPQTKPTAKQKYDAKLKMMRDKRKPQ